MLDAPLTPDEIHALYDFYNGTISTIASIRQFVKCTPQLAARTFSTSGYIAPLEEGIPHPAPDRAPTFTLSTGVA